jgi:quinol monooxygenase YgiN
MKNKHIVIAMLEAKAGKEDILKNALINVANSSRAEPVCVEYRLHQVSDNTAQFILYEIWDSKEAHQKQFEKPYITNLAQNLDSLLAKPYQFFFAQEI